MEGYTTSQLKAMLNKSSGASADEVRSAIRELKRRGEPTPPPSEVTGGRRKTGPLPKPKARMMRGGMANGKQHMYAAGGSVTENAGLKALKASGPKGRAAYNKIVNS
jgi:hypothetical protein